MPAIRDYLIDRINSDAERARTMPLDEMRSMLGAVGHLDVDRLTDRFGSTGRADLGAEFELDRSALIDPDAQLWFVTRRMAELAYDAAPDVPWTPTAARPSRHGVLWWEGGTGQMVFSLALDEWLDVDGCYWVSREDGAIIVVPLTVGGDKDGPHGVARLHEGRTLWVPTDGDVMQVGVATELLPLLGATWLLAQSPGVGRTFGVRYDRRDPDRPFARPPMPSTITVVTLREFDQGRQEINGMPRKGLDHQVMVRGHWRQQACGPKRAWRKPVFIAPHVRGPEGTPLVTKPAVHVWRR